MNTVQLRYPWPDEYERTKLLSVGVKLEHVAFAVCLSSFGRSQLIRCSTRINGEKSSWFIAMSIACFWTVSPLPPN